jgi:hypothetical protein
MNPRHASPGASLVLVLGLCLGACASGPELCRRDPITGSKQCQPSGDNYGEAAATAGIASGAWAVAGCTVNGCELPYRCNEKTKQCEPLQCTSNADCAGYGCDIAQGHCR